MDEDDGDVGGGAEDFDDGPYEEDLDEAEEEMEEDRLLQGNLDDEGRVEILDEAAGAGANAERVTTPYMTKYERARILGTRALQISMNAHVMVALTEHDTDPLQIAMKELAEGKIPFTVRRFLPNGSYEDWKVADLVIENQDRRYHDASTASTAQIQRPQQ